MMIWPGDVPLLTPARHVWPLAPPLVRAHARRQPPATFAALKAAIPKHCFEINTATSFKYLLMSTVLLFGMGILAHAFIPVKLAFLPLWLAYAVSLNLLAVAVDAMTAVSRSTLVGTDVFVIRKPPVEFGAPFH